ncbi:MAG TPA: acetylxylan esterase [Candidatus Sulfopaludibacter sp.]|jgi:cephalosporin-C deacetylase-like acetyl esterase|nr:acetylxylan esterase [Candidatus Sulfopaludibacter sp.]
MKLHRYRFAILLAFTAAICAQVPPVTLTPPASPATAPDAQGFIPRWLLLEPIESNGLTDSAVQAAVKKEYFPNQLTILPHDGDKVTVGGAQLTWHAVDTKLYNVNLYHFAHALAKPTTNVLFWVVTVIDVPQDMPGVRLAIGSNAASVWWVNGQEVIGIYGDRQTVIDDGVSKRLTLKKGPNVVRAAIINGGGATDFCARFLDADDRPLRGYTVRLSDAPAGPPQRVPIAQQLTFTPDHATGIYQVGETVGWTVTPGPETPAYSFKWTLRRNNAVVLKEGMLDLSSGKARIEVSGDRPEMIYGDIEPSGPRPEAGFVGGNTGRNTGLYAVGAAVAPEKIGLATPRPADFDAFWDGKLAAQSKVPINPVLTPVQTDVAGVELSMFVLDALGSKAHGYFAKPAREGKFPALIQLQYAGVYALNARGAAQHAAEGWLFLNVDSHDKLPSDPSGGIPRNYQAVGNTDREKSYFLNMYLRDSRVLDYLLTRPEWDGKTIVLTGGSMGGQQSLVLAGLRPGKITAVLVCVPAGADTNGDLHERKAGYPNWQADNPDVMNTARYFDTINFASRIQAPVMAGMGFIDTISPPAGVWTALNQIAAPKEPLPMIESEHDNLTPQKGRACPARTREILDLLVKGGEFHPTGMRQ